MEITDAITALAALAQENRLAIFRLLVQAGPAGLPARPRLHHRGTRMKRLHVHLSVADRTDSAQFHSRLFAAAPAVHQQMGQTA